MNMSLFLLRFVWAHVYPTHRQETLQKMEQAEKGFNSVNHAAGGMVAR